MKEALFLKSCLMVDVYVEGYDPISNRNVNELLSLFASWSEIIGDKYRNPDLLEAAE